MPTKEEKESLYGLVEAKIEEIEELLELIPMNLDKEVCMYHMEQFKIYAQIIIDNAQSATC